MSKHRAVPSAGRHGWSWFAVAAVVAVALGGGAWWWNAGATWPPGGTPKLVVDRDVIDLGNVPFETRVRAAFTLSNAGDGALRLEDVPRVKVLAGC